MSSEAPSWEFLWTQLCRWLYLLESKRQRQQRPSVLQSLWQLLLSEGETRLLVIHTLKVNNIACKIRIPKGHFCGHSCIECVYWNPNDKDEKGRQYCLFWGAYVQSTKMYGCGGFRQFK